MTAKAQQLPIVAPLEVKAEAVSEASGVAWPEAWLLDWGSPAALAGPAVTPASAMSVPAVAACVHLIAGAIGTLPAKVYRTAANGGREEATGHPAFALVHDDANAWTDAGQLREQLVTDALLRGNGFALVLRDADDTPRELMRLPPEAVSVVLDPRTGEPWFRVVTAAGLIAHSHMDIIHIPAPGGCARDGVSGVAPIVRARNAISLALAMEAHLAKLFRNGARPSGVMSFPAGSNVGGIGAEKALASFERQSSANNSGKPVVLIGGASWTPTEFTTVDLQFAQQRTAQTGEIARAFNVPPTLVGELAKATLGNSETMGRQFLRHTLGPWVRAVRTAYRRALITPEDRRNFEIDFVTDALLQADSAERAAFYSALRSAGVVTANEVRALENLPARPDGDSLASPHTATATPAPEAAADV